MTQPWIFFVSLAFASSLHGLIWCLSPAQSGERQMVKIRIWQGPKKGKGPQSGEKLSRSSKSRPKGQPTPREIGEPQGSEGSSPPQLIAPVKPEFTRAAISAEMQGEFAVAVKVAPDGAVEEARLVKKVGYGMDQRLLEAAKKARFTPHQAHLGIWTEIHYHLRLE